VRITIDGDACTGHGRCFVLAPEVFDSDDDGYSVLRFDDVPPELEERARIGAANCPERAITCA
jgi:ferredoxin